MAEVRIEAIEKKAMTEIEFVVPSGADRTELAISGLTSEAAPGLLEKLLIPRRPHPDIALSVGSQEHGYGLRMNWRGDGVRRGRQGAVLGLARTWCRDLH
jgi:hypothetical protein